MCTLKIELLIGAWYKEWCDNGKQTSLVNQEMGISWQLQVTLTKSIPNCSDPQFKAFLPYPFLYHRKLFPVFSYNRLLLSVCSEVLAVYAVSKFRERRMRLNIGVRISF